MTPEGSIADVADIALTPVSMARSTDGCVDAMMSATTRRSTGGTELLTAEILGELRLSVDGSPVELKGKQRRRLVALLCARAPEPVSTAELAECLDPAARSANPANAVQAHIRRLRAVIEPGVPGSGSRLLPAVGHGYALVPDRMDLWDLRAQLDRAREHRDADPAAAARTVSSVLDRWRSPWGSLGEDPVLSEHRWSLDVERLGIEDEWAALVVLAGADALVGDRLVDLVRAEPTRERRVADAMQALFQAGRQADALRLFDEVRVELRESLGVSPGPELDEMHQRVLRHDPMLQVHARSVRGLPHRVRVDLLVGRADLLGVLGELVQRHRIVTVVGPAGVGTTRLVEHWLTTECSAVTAVWLDVLAAVDGLDAALGDALGIGESVEGDRGDAARRAVPDGPSVVVLDGAERHLDEVADLVLALVEARPSLHVVVTSKVPLDLPGEQLLVVPPLPIEDAGGADGPAVELAADRLGPGASLELARRTAHVAAGLPLAIELEAGAVFDDHPEVRVGRSLDAVVAGRVPGPAAVIGVPGSLDGVVHAAVLRLSPAARSVLALASALPDGVGVAATKWRAEGHRDPTVADPYEHRRLLGELVRAQLVELHHDDRGVRYVARPQVAPVLGNSRAAASPSEVERANVEWICHVAGPGLDPPLVPDTGRRDLLRSEPRNVAAAMVTLRGDSARHVELLVALVPQLGRLPERSRLRREIEITRSAGLEPLDDARLSIADAVMVPDMAGVAARRAELFAALGVLERSRVAPEWTVAARLLNAIAAGWNGDVEGAGTHLVVAHDRARSLRSDWSSAVVDRYRSILSLVRGEPSTAVRIAVDAADRLIAVGDPIEALGALHFAATASWSAPDADTGALLDRAEQVAGADGSVFEPLLFAERARFALSLGAPNSAELLAAAAASLEAAGMLRTAAMTRRRLGLLLLGEHRHDAAFDQLLRAAEGLLALDPAGAALAIAGLVQLLDTETGAVADAAGPGRRELVGPLSTVACSLATARGTPMTDDERAELARLVAGRDDASLPAGSPAAGEASDAEVVDDARTLLASVHR